MVRKISLQNDSYYHIYNRGVDKRKIFLDKNDYIRLLISMREFNALEPIDSLYFKQRSKRTRQYKSGPTAYEAVGQLKPVSKELQTKLLVEIISYCLISNHYHFIVRQLTDNTISEFIKRLAGGYAWHFNYKYKRSGTLFQGKFKSTHITNETRLYWLSGYVNCNAEIHKTNKAENWIWSSYLDYIGKRNGNLCNKHIILDNFGNIEEYKSFCKNVIKEFQEIKQERKKIEKDY